MVESSTIRLGGLAVGHVKGNFFHCALRCTVRLKIGYVLGSALCCVVGRSVSREMVCTVGHKFGRMMGNTLGLGMRGGLRKANLSMRVEPHE